MFEKNVRKEWLELKKLENDFRAKSEQLKSLKLTNSEVGNEIPIEMQIDNLSDIADLSEIKKAPEKNNFLWNMWPT